MKLFTIQEFAKEKGLHVATIRKWIKEGRIKGIIKRGRTFLIPEENLSLELRVRKKRVKPPQTIEEARLQYNNISSDHRRKIIFDYDEMKGMLDQGRTIMEIADLAGVSKQRIQQIYTTYFGFNVTGRERRHSFVCERMRENAIISVEDSEKLSYLSDALAEMGLSMEIVQSKDLNRCYQNMAIINGHSCRIYLSKKATFSPLSTRNGERYKTYNRIQVIKSILNEYEFIIAIAGEIREAGENERRIFIIPSIDLKEKFGKEDRKSFYLPTDNQGKDRKISPVMDWWSYQGAWHLLKDNSLN